MSSYRFVVVLVISCSIHLVACDTSFGEISRLFDNYAVAEVKREFLEGIDWLELVLDTDPATRMTTPEMIRSEGYPAESHEVTTADGYVLTLHRIPASRPGSPCVFLQHGLLGSSFDWVLAGKNRSLAFILSDLGYDVWLGNSRGNTYSRKHVSIPVNFNEFWLFSWHEMGIYDLPAAIDYVLEKSQKKNLTYIGHSQGTTEFFVLASEKPDFAAEKIKVSFSLSPVVFMSRMKSPVRKLAFPLVRLEIQQFFCTIFHCEIFPHTWFVKYLAKFGCDINALEEKVCANALFFVCGFDTAQFNYTLLPRILHDFPAGSSILALSHYAQEIESGKFQKFDYGSQGNMKKYNQKTAPEYDLSKVKVPVGLFWAENDWLSSAQDVQQLNNLLPTTVLSYKVKYSKFNHIDYLWAINARELVYDRLISAMKKYD